MSRSISYYFINEISVYTGAWSDVTADVILTTDLERSTFTLDVVKKKSITLERCESCFGKNAVIDHQVICFIICTHIIVTHIDDPTAVSVDDILCNIQYHL